MSQTKGHLTSLSKDIGHEIAELISPLSRASLGRAFARGNLTFDFTQTQIRSAKVWDMMFKNESWLQAIDDLKYGYHLPPNPTLVGYDLTKLYYGSSTSAYIVLLVSDWKGDSLPFRGKLFASLREHDYDEQTCEVRFKNSNIVLNIRDAVQCSEWIEVKSPKRLFRCYEQKLKTVVLYYNDESLTKIGSDKIGGVTGMPMKRKKCIENICSLQLKFGNGSPAYRVLRKRDIPVRLINIQTADETGWKWVTSWRLARENEGEWWL